MAAWKGPNVPHRTPRKRALEFSPAEDFSGNDMNGAYVPQAGQPYMPGMPSTDLYEEMDPQVVRVAPSEGVTPFKLGGL